MQTYPSGTFFQLVPWVIFFPLLGLLFNLIFGRRSSEKTVGTVASLASGLAFLVASLLFFSLQKHPEAVVVPFADWINIGKFSINWAFRVDTLSVTMIDWS